MMKPNTKMLGVKSYQFPLQGGPYHKQKHRICEPLPPVYLLPLSDDNGWAYYRKTDLPERKLWPVMYIYDEVMSDDKNRTSDGRTRRLERLAKAALFGPREWYSPRDAGPRDVQKTAQTKGKRKSADNPTPPPRRAGNG